jgi:hypothetical protein
VLGDALGEVCRRRRAAVGVGPSPGEQGRRPGSRNAADRGGRLPVDKGCGRGRVAAGRRMPRPPRAAAEGWSPARRREDLVSHPLRPVLPVRVCASQGVYG